MSDNSVNMSLKRLNASLDRGGWLCDVALHCDADAITKNQRLDLYGRLVDDGAWGEKTLFFSGHALPQNIDASFGKSETGVVFYTSDEYLRSMSVQGIWFADVSGTPANPHQSNDLSLAYVVTHIIDGHCNLGPSSPPPTGHVVFDVDFASSARLGAVEVPEGNMWQRIRDLAENEYFVAYFNRQNHFVYRPHPYFDSPRPPISRTFTASDVSRVDLQVNRAEVRQVRLYAVTSAAELLSSIYPDDADGYGDVEEIDNLRCDDQATLDTWAGRRYAWETRPYSVQITVPGTAGLEMELLDRVGLTLSLPEDGISWTDRPAWVHEIDVTPTSGFGMVTTLSLEVEAG